MLEKWNEIPKELVLGWPRSVLLGDGRKPSCRQHRASMPVRRRRSSCAPRSG